MIVGNLATHDGHLPTILAEGVCRSKTLAAITWLFLEPLQSATGGTAKGTGLQVGEKSLKDGFLRRVFCLLLRMVRVTR